MLNEFPLKIKNIFIQRLWFYISKRRKYQLVGLLFLMILSGVSEGFTLAALVPILKFISDPAIAQNLNYFNLITNIFSLNNSDILFTIIVLFFIIIVVITAILRLVTLYLTHRVSNLIGHEISSKIFSNILSETYEKHLTIDKNSIIASLTEYIKSTIKAISLSLRLLTNIIISFSILVALLFIDFKSSIIAGSFFGITYIFIIIFTKFKYSVYSKIIALNTKDLYRSVRDSLSSIREIKMNINIENAYINNHKQIDYFLRKATANTAFLAASPRFIIEMLALISICLFAYISTSGSIINTTSLITLLGSFALASQKLLPALQLSYASYSSLITQEKSVLHVIDLLENKSVNFHDKEINDLEIIPPLMFKKSIDFNNVYFSYNKNKNYEINNFNFSLLQGERIGVIGESGSGKSTFIDLLLCLLKPDKGSITLDGSPLTINRNKPLFSHVPQEIFIKAGTFAENIAFGVEPDQIDINQLYKSAKMANLSEFIESLPYSYDTLINEDGTTLSGGQKQRILIARAFYKRAKIIILDEATSALDIKTSKEIKDELFKFTRDITLIIVSHDYYSIVDCDRIIELKDGFINRIGSPKEILPKLVNND